MKLKNITLIFLATLILSCERQTLELTKDNPDTPEIHIPTSPPHIDSAPVITSLTPNDGHRDIESTITLTYTDVDNDLASSCNITSLSNLTETTSCTCFNGTCTVGVTGTPNFTGPVSFNYTVTTNNVTSNSASVNFNIRPIGASNSDKWVKVPANAGGIGLPEFFVMKYEAKAWDDTNSNSVIDSGEVDSDGLGAVTSTNNWANANPNIKPVSIEDNDPWTEIDGDFAALECESIGSGYHVISNIEWMAIARDIETQGENWTGGAVGAGCIFKGNNGETTVGTGNTGSDSCGYNGNDPENGNVRDIRAKHTLSNGEEIFDLSGNVWEWTDWDKDTIGFQLSPTTCTESWEELPLVTCPALLDADYNTVNGGYSNLQGVGLFNGGGAGGALRGGRFVFDGYSGLFSLSVSFSKTTSNMWFGFRCVYRP